MNTLKQLSLTAAIAAAFCGAAAAQTQWQSVSPAGAGFSVQMPGTPQESTQTISTAVGSLAMHTYLYVKGSEGYFVAYASLPTNLRFDSEKLLDGARDGAFRKGRILSESAATLNGYPARMIIGTTGPFNAVLKVSLVNGKLYQVLYLSSSQPSQANTASFFDSFSLTRYASR